MYRRLSRAGEFDTVPRMLISFNDVRPTIAPTAYVQDSAQIIGDVVIDAHASVWFNVVIRGDVHHVRIGERTNIQDNSTLHVASGRWPTLVGAGVTVGHAVVLHGCRVADRCLIGMGAIVMDGADIGAGCLVGAGALVAPGTKIPPGQLVIGRPAQVVRPLRPEEMELIERSAANYVAYAASYRAQGIR